jgi:hypothetical protein
VMHCSLADIYQCLGGTCCLASKHHTSEDSIFVVIIVTISDSYHCGILSACVTPAVCIKYLYRNTGENIDTYLLHLLWVQQNVHVVSLRILPLHIIVVTSCLFQHVSWAIFRWNIDTRDVSNICMHRQ